MSGSSANDETKSDSKREKAKSTNKRDDKDASFLFGTKGRRSLMPPPTLTRRLTDPGFLPESIQNIPSRIRRKVNQSNKSDQEEESSKNVKGIDLTHQQTEKDLKDVKNIKLFAASNNDVSFRSGTQLTPRKQTYSLKDSVGKEYLLELEPKKTLSSKNVKNQLVQMTEEDTQELLPNDIVFDPDFKYTIALERKRQKIICEMMNTEKTYFEFLRTVTMLFISPLRKSIKQDPVPLLTPEQLSLVFQNIEEINQINGELLKKMAKRKRKSAIHWADMLISFWSQSDFIQAYQTYINGYTHARMFVSDAMKLAQAHSQSQTTSAKQEPLVRFAEFINRQLSHDLCLGFGNVNSFLITPIQRLPRYLLYLKDLHDCTPEGHPDREDVEKAYELLLQVTEQIDQQKLKYDEIYHVQALFQKFNDTDQQFVQEIIDPMRKLLGEGPLLENIYEDLRHAKKGEKEKVLRYVLLFNDILVCATKNDDERLVIEWKVSIYTCKFQLISKQDDMNGEAHFLITDRVLTTGFPASVAHTHELYPFNEGPFSMKYWLPLFEPLIKGQVDSFYYTHTGILIAQQLQHAILSEKDWNELTKKGKEITLNTGEAVLEENQIIDHFYYVKEGRCNITKPISLSQVMVIGVMEPGELFGEMSFLSRSKDKPSATSIVADKDSVKVIKISHSQMNKNILSVDANLSRRFFQSLAFSICLRFLKVVYQRTGMSREEMIPLVTQQTHNTACVLSAEARGILLKLKIDYSQAIAEIPCKMRGKIGKGHLLICSGCICYFSRPPGLFGHLSKSFFPVTAINNIYEIVGSGSILMEFTDGPKRQTKEVDLQFSTVHQRKRALILLSSFVTTKTTDPPLTSFELTKEDWTLLVKSQKHSVFSKGEVIVAAGSYSEGLVQVIKGECVMQFAAGESRIDVPVKAGEVFGELPFFLGIVSIAALIANTEQVVVRLISRRLIEKMTSTHPNLGAKLYLFLARTLRSRFLTIKAAFLTENENGSESDEYSSHSEMDSEFSESLFESTGKILPKSQQRKLQRKRVDRSNKSKTELPKFPSSEASLASAPEDYRKLRKRASNPENILDLDSSLKKRRSMSKKNSMDTLQ